MKLSTIVKWALSQGLGSKRGALVIALLEGPVGSLIDLSSQGKGSQALGKLDDAIDKLRALVVSA